MDCQDLQDFLVVPDHQVPLDLRASLVVLALLVPLDLLVLRDSLDLPDSLVDQVQLAPVDPRAVKDPPGLLDLRVRQETWELRVYLVDLEVLVYLAHRVLLVRKVLKDNLVVQELLVLEVYEDRLDSLDPRAPLAVVVWARHCAPLILCSSSTRRTSQVRRTGTIFLTSPPALLLVLPSLPGPRKLASLRTDSLALTASS